MSQPQFSTYTVIDPIEPDGNSLVAVFAAANLKDDDWGQLLEEKGSEGSGYDPFADTEGLHEYTRWFDDLGTPTPYPPTSQPIFSQDSPRYPSPTIRHAMDPTTPLQSPSLSMIWETGTSACPSPPSTVLMTPSSSSAESPLPYCSPHSMVSLLPNDNPQYVPGLVPGAGPVTPALTVPIRCSEIPQVIIIQPPAAAQGSLDSAYVYTLSTVLPQQVHPSPGHRLPSLPAVSYLPSPPGPTAINDFSTLYAPDHWTSPSAGPAVHPHSPTSTDNSISPSIGRVKKTPRRRSSAPYKSGDGVYVCEECDETFTLQRNYNAHMRLPRHNPAAEPHRCNFCPCHYQRAGDLRRHVKHKHMKHSDGSC